MIGGGFLGQMHETMKKNRDMVRSVLGKKNHTPFDNGEFRGPHKKNFLEDNKSLSASERQELISKILEENKREKQRKFLMLIISIAVLVLIYLGLVYFLE